ncbi:T9SS C-terminal target domain-containing protein [Chryseobacterium sp. G0162]|uniref:T9SS type A sorting domain-containing protein n=1 Tax=Chryseobacterium sp. G0162 TaxID=2487063 RepID=UPI000F516F23|nr:T9SS type A sorting domain-containing protein [Chryseobacterium sp. G0162]AZB09579.1 T9SS C-terminal target domain-containing protein [Chryseobacterium sp. G0162]
MWNESLNRIFNINLSIFGVPLTEAYALPTSVLAAKEIQAGSKLSAFPVPTNKILNVMNPGNGANKIEIFDVTGKLVTNKSFSASEGKISVAVENLPKGVYVYKIGNLSSKFTKN